MRIGNQVFAAGRIWKNSLLLGVSSQNFDRLGAQYHLHGERAGKSRAGLGDFFRDQADRNKISARTTIFNRCVKSEQPDLGGLGDQVVGSMFFAVDLNRQRLDFLASESFGHIAQRNLILAQPVQHRSLHH